MPEFIFVMKDLRKVVPPKREILKGIYLSFYFGAKIGVLGLNGSGKSSLLKVMAGVDDQFMGEAFPAKGIRVGLLTQEPTLDPAKTVLGNVEEGVAPQKALLDRFNAIGDRLAEPIESDEMDKLLTYARADFPATDLAHEGIRGVVMCHVVQVRADAARKEANRVAGGVECIDAQPAPQHRERDRKRMPSLVGVGARPEQGGESVAPVTHRWLDGEYDQEGEVLAGADSHHVAALTMQFWNAKTGQPEQHHCAPRMGQDDRV